MILFDTDTLTLLHTGNANVVKRVANEPATIAITVITRIEVLLGRFNFVLKAANGDELRRAQASLSGGGLGMQPNSPSPG